MTPEQLAALIGSITALIVALGVTVTQVRGLRRDVDGRITELLSQSALAHKRLGELEGRDFVQGAPRARADGGALPPPHGVTPQQSQ